MRRLKLAVRLCTLGFGPRRSLDLAGELGLDAVEVSTESGPFSPEELSLSGRRHLLKMLADRRLEVAATEVDAGGEAMTPERVEESVERFRRVVDLSVGLCAPIIVMRVGQLPPEEAADAHESLLWGACEAGGYAINYATRIAVETPPQEPSRLREFIDTADCEGVKVGYDPAVLAAAGFDPLAALAELCHYTSHVTARDAAELDGGRYADVLPGGGIVPFRGIVEQLDEHNYTGAYALGATGGENAADDIARGRDFFAAF